MDPPTTVAMHSFPGIASLWLHLRLSNDFARSTAGWCDFPWRYSSWMQHCVITDEPTPLGQTQQSSPRSVPSSERGRKLLTQFHGSDKYGLHLGSQVRFRRHRHFAHHRVDCWSERAREGGDEKKTIYGGLVRTKYLIRLPKTE